MKYLIILLLLPLHLHSQSLNIKDCIVSKMDCYYEKNIDPKYQHLYYPIIDAIKYKLDTLFNIVNLDSILKYDLKSDIYILSVTDYLGSMIYTEIWMNDSMQFFCSIGGGINGNRTILNNSFPEFYLSYKKYIENWDEDFENKSLWKSDIADAPYFIAFKIKSCSNIKIKAFVAFPP